MGACEKVQRRCLYGVPFGNGGEGEKAQGTERPRTPTSGAGRSWGSKKEDKEEVARSRGEKAPRGPQGCRLRGVQGPGGARGGSHQESPRTHRGRRGTRPGGRQAKAQ